MSDRVAYDVAVSFAGAQRSLVENYVRECEALGLRVFYDKNVTTQMWGRNFILEFRKIYGQGIARYVVPFFSEEFLSSAYPRDEYDAAVTWSIELRDDVYILPVMVGDVKVPKELLGPQTGYLRADEVPAKELARITAERVRGAMAMPNGPAAGVLLPDIAPENFSSYNTLENVLSVVGQRFRSHSALLRQYGYTGRVRATDTSVDFRVEAQGQQVYGLRTWIDDSFGEEKLAVGWGWPRYSGSGMNGWATARWDGKRGQAALSYEDVVVTAEEFSDLLWRKVAEYLEQRRR